MLNLLFIPAWAWIVSAVIIAVAALVIAGIVFYDKKFGLGNKPWNTSDNSSDGETAAAESKSKTVKTETKKTKTKKTVAEEAPAEEKPAAKTTAKTTTKTAKPAAATATTAATSATAAKSSAKVYHISKRKEDGKWQIKAAGGEKAIKLFKTQKEAIDYCKTLAENQEASIMIHKEDGSFRKLSY